MIRFLAQLIGYLLGSIPFGYLIARSKGVDIRTQGSGNIGATNVGRVLGFRFFVLVFLLDFMKGALPVALFLLLQRYDPDPQSAWHLRYLYTPELAGFAAILGHMFPIYLGFRGGKGVATTIGVIVLIAPWAALWGLAAWVFSLLMFRMVSVSSILFAVVFVFAHLTDTRIDPYARDQLGVTVFVLVVALLIIVSHHKNIGRIVAGREPKVRLFKRKSSNTDS